MPGVYSDANSLKYCDAFRRTPMGHCDLGRHNPCQYDWHARHRGC